MSKCLMVDMRHEYTYALRLTAYACWHTKYSRVYSWIMSTVLWLMSTVWVLWFIAWVHMSTFLEQYSFVLIVIMNSLAVWHHSLPHHHLSMDDPDHFGHLYTSLSTLSNSKAVLDIENAISREIAQSQNDLAYIEFAPRSRPHARSRSRRPTQHLSFTAYWPRVLWVLTGCMYWAAVAQNWEI